MSEEKDTTLAKEIQNMLNEVSKEWGETNDDKPVESNEENEAAKNAAAIEEKSKTPKETPEVPNERELPKKSQKGKLSLLDFWGFRQ